MSDQSPNPNNSPLDGATPTEAPASPSLRETIESAYDDVIDASEGEEAGLSERTRDSLGRFAKAESGEQSTDPAPKEISETPERPTEPAPEGSSTQIPEHWSADVRADLARLPPETQTLFLRRYGEMEADYTRKSQASAGAVQFANALDPVFNDPDIVQAMQATGMNAVQVIHDWGGLQKRAMSPDPREKIGLLVEMTQRMGLDPARIFATGNRQEPQLSEADRNDPAIQYFANQNSELTHKLQAVEARIQQMDNAAAFQRQEQVKEGYLWQINQFGDEKDQQGNPLHPHLDRVMPHLHQLFAIDPGRDLGQAYKLAVRMDDELYRQELEAERQKLSGKNSAERARLAVRGNTRGITSPVSKPSAGQANGGLRGVLEASADEVGF